MIPGFVSAGAMGHGGGGGGGDPHWANVAFLLRFNGVDTSTTFTDEKGNSWTPSGNAQISTANQKFDGNGLFDGSGDYLSCNTNWPLHNADFTFDVWLRPEDVSINRTIFYTGSIAPGSFGVLVRQTGDGILFAMIGKTPNVSASSVFTINTWHFLSVCRDSTSTRIYVDGVKVAEGVQPNGFDAAAHVAKFGNYHNSDWLLGRLDEARLTMGVARYTSDFTPPTDPFPNN